MIAKLVGDEDERAVSPVIGVILMVAITVILAAVIAAFVLDLGQGQSANAQAGIEFDEESDGSGNQQVTATINSIERADSISFSEDCGGSVTGDVSSGDFDPLSAGSSITVDSCSSGDTIQIIGEYEGSENVITEYEVKG